jgi:3-oxoacyl-[acyl-carrier protein] reductase
MINHKIAFLTGCSGDLGIQLAKKLIKNKYKIICHIRKPNKKFSQFKLENKKNILLTINFDLIDEKKVISSMKYLIKKFNRIDALIINAAIPFGSIFEMTKIDKIKEVFQINFFSQLIIIQYLIKLLKKSKNPSIINISSLSSLIPLRGNISYGGSKVALNYATKVLANELNNSKIRVNAIAPTVLKNKMGDLMDKKAKEELLNYSFNKKILDMKDVEELLIYLLSSKSKSINGQILRIDGGMIF